MSQILIMNNLFFIIRGNCGRDNELNAFVYNICFSCISFQNPDSDRSRYIMSNIKFWNKQNSNNQNNDSKTTKNGRDWLHAPDVLVNGHVAYLVKVRFL